MIVTLRSSADPHTINDASLFVRDLVLIVLRHGVGVYFPDAFPAYITDPALEQLVLSNDHQMRVAAVCTQRKTLGL